MYGDSYLMEEKRRSQLKGPSLFDEQADRYRQHIREARIGPRRKGM